MSGGPSLEHSTGCPSKFWIPNLTLTYRTFTIICCGLHKFECGLYWRVAYSRESTVMTFEIVRSKTHIFLRTIDVH